MSDAPYVAGVRAIYDFFDDEQACVGFLQRGGQPPCEHVCLFRSEAQSAEEALAGLRNKICDDAKGKRFLHAIDKIASHPSVNSSSLLYIKVMARSNR